jgi:hypothetical protein
VRRIFAHPEIRSDFLVSVFAFKRDEYGGLKDLDVIPVTHDFQLSFSQVASGTNASLTITPASPAYDPNSRLPGTLNLQQRRAWLMGVSSTSVPPDLGEQEPWTKDEPNMHI